MIGDISDLAEGGDSTFGGADVQKDDRGDDEVEHGSTILLVLINSVRDITVRGRRKLDRLLRGSEGPHV